MRRRSWLALPLACMTLPALAQGPRYTVGIEQIEEAVAGKFPRRYPVAGLLNLDLQAPRLRLLPAQNRLGAEMAVLASGPALGRSYPGVFDVDFGLRYVAADRTLRAANLRVNALRLEGLPPDAAMLLDAYGKPLAEQALRDVVLHQLREKDLALADGMGLQPGDITVTERGLRIGFVPK
ncbi:MAG: DUF1439 domain-containing protein [Acidovorax sp.]